MQNVSIDIIVKLCVIICRRFDDALADIQEAVRLIPHGNSDIRHVLLKLKDDVQNKIALEQNSQLDQMIVARPAAYH